MKKAVLIWRIPVLSGEPYKGIDYFVYHKTAEDFGKMMNQYFEENHMQWQMVLDDTNADVDELLARDMDLCVLAPGGKTRCWMYKKKVKDAGIPLYDLEMEEYRLKEVEKLGRFIRMCD